MTTRVPVERGSSEVIERIIRGGSRTGVASPSPPVTFFSDTTDRQSRAQIEETPRDTMTAERANVSAR